MTITFGETRTYKMRSKRHSGDRIYYDNISAELLDFERPLPKPVLTKQDFYERFYKGEFGNHGLMWKTIDEWWLADYKHPITIRTFKPGGRCDYNIPRRKVFQRALEFQEQGWIKLNLSAMAPTERTILQGEVAILEDGLNLFASRLKLPMRNALAEGGLHHTGVVAYQLLRNSCDLDSYEWLMYLCETYDEHVVEFSCFECDWGVIERKNTVIWEVRRY